MDTKTTKLETIGDKLTIPIANGCTPLNAGDITDHAKDSEKTLRGFQPGNKHGIGNRRGKQRLTTAFVDDLSYEWSTRGQAALAELSGDKLVQACIAILPKDVLVSLNQADKVSWVINASPQALTTDEWLEQHNLIEQDKD